MIGLRTEEKKLKFAGDHLKREIEKRLRMM